MNVRSELLRMIMNLHSMLEKSRKVMVIVTVLTSCIFTFKKTDCNQYWGNKQVSSNLKNSYYETHTLTLKFVNMFLKKNMYKLKIPNSFPCRVCKLIPMQRMQTHSHAEYANSFSCRVCKRFVPNRGTVYLCFFCCCFYVSLLGRLFYQF